MTSSECPQCLSKTYKRNGYTRHGKQNHRCLECGRQFSLEPLYVPVQKDASLFAGFIVPLQGEASVVT